MNGIKCLVALGILAIMVLGCKSDYQRYVEEELATGETYDSLILGMHMGLTKKDFYAVCWDLNKQEVVYQGTGNTSAYMQVDKDTLGDVSETKDVLFYGIFDEENVMRGMRMTYSYAAWAPWNEDKHADSLMRRLREQYLLAYPGNEFMQIDIKEPEVSAWVKIDGNRQILMYPVDDKDVNVRIEDLNYKLESQWAK